MTIADSLHLETRTILLPVSDSTTMPAYLARPAVSEASVGLLVFQEAFGVNRHIRDVTERCARAGYTALAKYDSSTTRGDRAESSGVAMAGVAAMSASEISNRAGHRTPMTSLPPSSCIHRSGIAQMGHRAVQGP